MKNENIKHIGKKYTTNQGYEIEIIEYVNSLNVVVIFTKTRNTIKTRLDHIRTGKINNVMHNSVFGIGVIGVGKHEVSTNGKINRNYSVWSDMIKRCYSEKHSLPSYKNVTVCNEWHNFQNFAEWYNKNYIEGFELDKDIIIKGNKVYNPETCCFVPHEINTLFVKSDKIRGDLPIGVTYHLQNKNYVSQIKLGLKNRKHLGSFSSPVDAFNKYKASKEYEIKIRAEKYKNIITKEVYNALINYKVEITD